MFWILLLIITTVVIFFAYQQGFITKVLEHFENVKSPVTSPLVVSATGIVDRGPIRVNIIDHVIESECQKLGVNLKKKDPSHTGFIYKEEINVAVNGKPVTVVGYKDNRLVHSDCKEYGYYLAKDGSFAHYFESLIPRKVHGSRLYHTTGTYQIGDKKGEIAYKSDPKGKQKAISLHGIFT